jgi:hypothetical protein
MESIGTINKKSFQILDQRINKINLNPVHGTFNPLETRSLREMQELIYKQASIPANERDQCTITFRASNTVLYVSSPCDLMGIDDISATIIDRDPSSKSDGEQPIGHSEFEWHNDSFHFQHINPMPLFTTNAKGKFSKRPLSSDIPTERSFIVPKLQSVSPHTQNICKYSHGFPEDAIHMQMSEKNLPKIKKGRQIMRNPTEADLFNLTKQNECIKRKLIEMENSIKKTRENYLILQKQLIDPHKIIPFVKERIDMEWEQKKAKLFSQLLSSQSGLIEKIAKEKIVCHIGRKQKELNEYINTIESKLTSG